MKTQEDSDMKAGMVISWPSYRDSTAWRRSFADSVGQFVSRVLSIDIPGDVRYSIVTGRPGKWKVGESWLSLAFVQFGCGMEMMVSIN